MPIAYMVTYFTVYTLLTGLEKGRKSSKLSMVRTAYFLLVTYLIVYTLLTSLENGWKSSQISNGANCLLFYWLLILLSTRFQPVWKTEGKTPKLSKTPIDYCSTCYLFYCLHALIFHDNLPQKAISPLSGKFCPQMVLKGTQDWDFFWLRFWNLCYFFISYVKILRFYIKIFW